MNPESILQGIEDCPLHRRTPFGMTNVSMTQLSIARFYGQIIYGGEYYVYNPVTDELIRSDVLEWKHKQKRIEKKAAIEADQHPEFFGKDETQLDK